MSWTPEQAAEIVQLFADGMTQTEIARKTGRTLKAVNAKLARSGIDTHPTQCRNGHPWSDNEAFTASGERYCKACYRKRKGMRPEDTCRNGHALTEENVFIRNGSTRCVTCHKAAQARWRLTRNAKRRVLVKKQVSTWANDETKALARSLYEQGIGPKAIAQQIGNGCTSSAINGVKDREGWAKRTGPCKPWLTEEWIAKARAWWDAGYSAQEVASRINMPGCTKRSVLHMQERYGWSAHVQCRTQIPRLGYSPEQAKRLTEIWGIRKPLAEIIAELNAIGPKSLTATQWRKLAFARKLRRPRKLPQPARRPAVVHKFKSRSPHIHIPMRQVYQLAADLGLPRSKRGDIAALNKAVRATQPDHPGYAVADYQPTRLRWAI